MGESIGWKWIVNTSLAFAIFLILMSAVILSFFNSTYNTIVTGLSSTVWQGILLISLIVFIFSVILKLSGFGR